MKLVHIGMDMQLEFDRDPVKEVIIESPDCFMLYIRELIRQSEGEEGGFVLSEDDKIQNISKCIDIIVNPFDVDINDKKILGKIYDQLKLAAYDERFYVHTQEMIRQVLSYIIDLINDSDFIMDINADVDMSLLFKATGVKLECDEDDFLEKIFKYIELVTELLNKKLIIFVNLRNYINDNKYKEFIDMCRYKKLSVLLLESSKMNRISCVKQYIIDKDRCEIF